MRGNLSHNYGTGEEQKGELKACSSSNESWARELFGGTDNVLAFIPL